MDFPFALTPPNLSLFSFRFEKLWGKSRLKETEQKERAKINRKIQISVLRIERRDSVLHVS